mmetsp:Transcript_145726/g.271373  ORF Transcript_145726/g.271373 Transcript_145726/m.271373 type:complete len:122 (+) Transcript_145726:1150-1515(+)
MPFASQLKPASTNKDKISATANVAEPAKNDQSIVFLVPNLGWSDSTVSSEIASDEITMPKLDIKMLIVFLPPRSPWNRDSSLRADAEANSTARIPPVIAKRVISVPKAAAATAAYAPLGRS